MIEIPIIVLSFMAGYIFLDVVNCAFRWSSKRFAINSKDLMDTFVKDLPHPHQRWKWKGHLIRIENVSIYETRTWMVAWYFIKANGEKDFNKSYVNGPSVAFANHMELGRFLQRAKKV